MNGSQGAVHALVLVSFAGLHFGLVMSTIGYILHKLEDHLFRQVFLACVSAIVVFSGVNFAVYVDPHGCSTSFASPADEPKKAACE